MEILVVEYTGGYAIYIYSVYLYILLPVSKF